MSEAKRYYWLKLQDGFFTSKRIKKLRKMAGGDTYTIIYLKMQLLAMKTDGVLTFTGLESEFADELALDLDESPDDVRVTLLYLLSCGLAETSDNVSFFFPWAVANTGCETAAAKRMRDMRGRNNVTPMLRDRYGEKEIEIEQETEKEKETEQEKDSSLQVCGKDRGMGEEKQTDIASLDFSTPFPQVYKQPSEEDFTAMREAALKKLEGRA